MEAARALAPTHPLQEWDRLTRFLESARLAFARERTLWGTLGIDDHVRISQADANGSYEVGLDQHLGAIDDAETLHASVLIHSYALAESAAADRLGVSSRSFNGIEDWGGRLLSGNGTTWDDVRGGRAGAVKAAVVRNAFAHGARAIDEAARARLVAVGVKPETVRVSLTYVELRGHRNRLLGLLAAGGITRP